MDYNEIFEMLITELNESALKACRTENSDLDMQLNELVSASEKLRTYLACFDEQVQNDFERYINLMNTVAERQRKYLYLQGAKDCAALLKYLKIV